MATGEAQSRINSEEVKNQWVARLSKLIDEVSAWAQSSGWQTRRIEKTVSERVLGIHKVPVLLMEKNTVQVVLNPVARYVPGADGAVDLYLAPAYDDIATLFYLEDHWVIHYVAPNRTNSPPSDRNSEILAYTEENIRTILDGMTSHG